MDARLGQGMRSAGPSAHLRPNQIVAVYLRFGSQVGATWLKGRTADAVLHISGRLKHSARWAMSNGSPTGGEISPKCTQSVKDGMALT